MRLPFRRKDKSKNGSSVSIPDEFRPAGALRPPLFPPTWHSGKLAAQLPENVLKRIFALVCPHSRDESYETADGSVRSGGCMLCDLRDLAHCARVNRRWRLSAIQLLYHSIRIDPVHYCDLEGYLADKRKRKKLDRNGIPEDPAQARLKLLRRTVRDDPTRIGKLVQFLKLTYMLRESSQVELAQTIAVLPNLQYVDLPQGMFSDDPGFATLRLEVQARCPNLRKMIYDAGSEKSFELLGTGQIWTNIQVLELNGLNVDPRTMRNVLGCMQNLRALKVTDTVGFSDESLAYVEGYPAIPPLEELVLKDTPRVTTAGLVEYLAWHETQQVLKVLTIHNTGVSVPSIQEILNMATSLDTLAVQASISDPFPNSSSIFPLSSQSLKTLRFQISGPASKGAWASLTAGYYSYLANSIMSDSLPNVRRLYVEDETFPDQLQSLPPPQAAFANGQPRTSLHGPPRSPLAPSIQVTPADHGFNGNGHSGQLSPFAQPVQRPISRVPPTNRFSSNNPFAARSTTSPPPAPHMLEIFTKTEEFGKWNFARVDTFRSSPAASANHALKRPTSSYGLAKDVQGMGWDRADARRSVMVGSGAGGFLELEREKKSYVTGDSALTVTEQEYRPRSSAGEKGNKDLWR